MGWSSGLALGVLAAGWLGGPGGVLIAGLITGTVVGWLQGLALSYWLAVDRRGWVLRSVIGGTLGVLPLFALVFLLFVGNIGLIIAGTVYGLCFGWAQSGALVDRDGARLLWLAGSAAGGGACALLTFGAVPLALPVICTAGPPVFGLITGLVLLWLRGTLHD